MEDLVGFSIFNVTGDMHRAGINLRYIGLVVTNIIIVATPSPSFRTQTASELSGLPIQSYDPTLRSLIVAYLNEALARVIKNELNLQLRIKVRELKLPLEVRLFFFIVYELQFVVL